jgi:predicted aldo/keto reductase-like oxidoreductase
MYYKQYGDTDMRVSAIGMGTMRYDDDDVAAGSLEKCAEVPLYAFEKGINYFDTAPFYCSDKSEEITGIALSQLPRDKFYVSSKINLGTVQGDTSRDAFFRRLETSLKRLKVDYLDFYHMWCILSLDSYEKTRDALYGHMLEAKEQGMIRNLAFSSHLQGADIEKIIAEDRFKGMLLGYNALNYRFRQSGIEAAHKKGMGVVVMNPLGGGVIPKHPDTFRYLAEGTDLSVAQAGLRFVASHKEITITLSGMTTKAHVDDAVKAVEGLEERPAREIVAEYESRGVSLNDLCTSCGYCNYCPVGIPIPKFMDSYNQKILSGGEDQEITGRLKGHWGVDINEAKQCIACRKCEGLCTQHLPIVARLQEIAELA